MLTDERLAEITSWVLKGSALPWTEAKELLAEVVRLQDEARTDEQMLRDCIAELIALRQDIEEFRALLNAKRTEQFAGSADD